MQDGIFHMKIERFAHQEFNNQKIKSPEHIRNCMVNGKYIYGRGGTEHAVLHYGYRQVSLSLLKSHEEICELQNVSPDTGKSIL